MGLAEAGRARTTRWNSARLAERVGFEPTRVIPYALSRRAH